MNIVLDLLTKLSTIIFNNCHIYNMNSLLKWTRYFFCQTVEIVERQKTKISKFQLKNFSDSVKLLLKAGKGGNGAIAYFSDKKIRYGAPDGGDGGEGGNIEVQAHRPLHDLSNLRHKSIKGVDGQSGGNNGKQGKNGGKTLLRVPVGTLIYEIKMDEEKESKHLLVDLHHDKQHFVLAKGGKGGKGNKQHQNMLIEERWGVEGEEKIVYFELKTLADIGLVGFPNIGKSTFLAAVSRALPKIANYQFTTLKPSVGHVKFVDDYSMTIADIPGIIENAHNNKGLGFQFLRHIERTKILIFMLDITHSDPLEQYRILENELFQYKNNIFKNKKRIVIFNKMDCLQDSESKFKIFSDRVAAKSFLVSAKQGEGLGAAIVQLRRLKQEIDEKERLQDELSLKKMSDKDRLVK